MYSGLDSVQGMIKRIKKELQNNDIQVVLTGGFSHLISEKLEVNHITDEMLSLYGLKEIFTEFNE